MPRVLANPNTHIIDIYSVREYKLSLKKKKNLQIAKLRED